jgi:hypothetical protein
VAHQKGLGHRKPFVENVPEQLVGSFSESSRTCTNELQVGAKGGLPFPEPSEEYVLFLILRVLRLAPWLRTHIFVDGAVSQDITGIHEEEAQAMISQMDLFKTNLLVPGPAEIVVRSVARVVNYFGVIDPLGHLLVLMVTCTNTTITTDRRWRQIEQPHEGLWCRSTDLVAVHVTARNDRVSRVIEIGFASKRRKRHATL